MSNVNLFASAVLAVGLCSLHLAAQQNSSPATPGDQTQQSTPGQTTTGQAVPGNHSDPNATIHNGSGDGQKPANDNPDPGAGQGAGNANPGSANGSAVSVQHTANSPEVANPKMRSVRAELVGELDSKSAKAGDQVVLKTTENATTADGTMIPKGSKIKGHVVNVRRHDDANRNAQVALQFTQAELKNGKMLSIQSVLQSVSPAGGSAAAADANPMPSGVMGNGGTGAQAGGAAPAGGGMNGPSPASSGVAGAGMNGSEGVNSGQAEQPQGNMGASQPSAAQGANTALAPGTVVAQQGNVQIKTTAVPGVLMETNAEGEPFANASGALLGAGQNVHLDGGTRMELAIETGNEKPGQR